MRLISCHIDGFGTISDKDYTFEKGLNGVLGENGAGKSTLTAFLSAMLYGMRGVRINAKEFSDRKHFYPFSGGAFGGSLVIEGDGGDVYKIRRLFDEKSETEDKTEVFKNDSPFDCGDKQIGEILFGVDADAFSRTVFFSADTLDPEPGSIAKKLCETVATPTGSVPAEDAIDALDKAAKELKKGAGRKTGLLDQAITAATDAEDALRAAETKAKLLPALREEYDRAEAEWKTLKARTLWDSYDDLRAEADAAEAKLAAVNARFKDGVPDEAALAEAERRITARADAAKAAETDFVPSKRQAEISARFASGRPDEATLARMEAKAEEIRNAQTAAIPAAAPQPAPAKPKTSAWVFPVAALGGLALLAGLILLILSYTVAGVILLAAGLVGLGAAGFALFQGKVNALAKTIAVADPNGAERARRAQLDADLSALLAPYGYPSPDGALAAFNDLKRDLGELETIDEQRAEAEVKKAEAKEKAAAYDRELAAFFKRYGIDVDAGYRSAMNALQEAIREKLRLARYAEQTRKAAADFAAKQGLTEPRPVGGEAADPETIERIEKEKNRLFAEILDAEKTANGVPALAEERDRKNERVEELKIRYRRLREAHKLLQTAQNNLVGRYVDPVKRSFVEYADALSSFLGGAVTLDENFTLRFEKDGAPRDHRHLSAGERSVAGLCLRMALADNLYAGKEQPPLILDDPLVHLDETNLAKAKDLLRMIAKKRQILCLTCHGSRAV